MPDINPSLPQVGQPDSTEEPKIVTALSQLIAAVNDVDSDQIADGTITLDDLIAGASGLAKGSFSATGNTQGGLTDGLAVVFPNEEWDQSGWYNAANGQFQPQVAGIYRLSWSLQSSSALLNGHTLQAVLRKNGLIHRAATADVGVSGRAAPNQTSAGSSLVVANGTTDIFTVVISQNTGGVVSLSNTSITYFQGELVART